MKSTKKRTLRCKRCKRCNRCKTNRRHKHVKGGMRRAATQTAKKVFEGVFGKGPDRVEKMYEIGQAVAKGVEGATKETAIKGSRSSTRSFEDIASPQTPFHISHVKNPMTSRMSSHDENENPNYNTPKKPPSTSEPKLPLRQRQSPQTPNTRMLRLSSIVAPTMNTPTPVATRLSFDDEL